MDYHNAAVITPPDVQELQIILAGGGGTGSYMAQHLGRILSVLRTQMRVTMTIVDPQTVAEENVDRQLFCRAEIGVPKAEALMRRYSQAWGLPVSSYVGKYDESLVIGLGMTLIVGCVDGAEGRKAIHATLMNNPTATAKGGGQPTIWWLDCGNANNSGRVLLGTAMAYEQLRGAFPNDKTCLALPGPGLQSPGLLVEQPEEYLDSNMSCAQLAAANLQSLNINASMAVQAADMVTRLLVTRDLRRYACDVNVGAGVVKSYYATAEAVAAVCGKQASFVQGLAQSVEISEELARMVAANP